MSLAGQSELTGIDAFLTQLMGTDAVLRAAVATLWAATQEPAIMPAPSVPAYRWLHADLAPQETPYPLVLFNCMIASDVQGVGKHRIATPAVYQIKAIGRDGSFADLAPIYGRVDTLLEGFAPTLVNGVMVCSARRQSAIKTPENNNNVRYSHLGGLYRFFTYAPGD